MINRELALKKLSSYKDKEVIKVVTGVRRCGKSTLLKIFQEQLLNQGVNQANIAAINFDDFGYRDLLQPEALYAYLQQSLSAVEEKLYIFLDEVQNVKDFERIVSSLYLRKEADIYITGSNALLLSSELSTKLSGRYIEIQLLPFSFKEYHDFRGNARDKDFQDYLVKSSFPYLSQFDDRDEIDDYLQGIYNTVIVKDIVARKAITDVSLLQDILRFLVSNIGSIISKRKIQRTLISYGRKTSVETVDTYVQALVEAYIIHRCDRYDVKGRKYFQNLEKYYVVDLGLKHLLTGHRFQDLGHNLENIVYLELVRRGYRVYVGKLENTEVDFVAMKNGLLEYYQITTSMMDETVQERELRPLQAIKDNFPKYILSMDKNAVNDRGIQHLNIIDWLLGDLS